MKVKNLFVLISFLLAIISAGCTSDDDSENPLTVNFQLQNADGDECYSFHEGENIIFRLEIKNNTDDDVRLPPIDEILGFDIFHVYSKNGEDMGMSWDGIVTNFLPFYAIPAHTSDVKICPWFNIPSLATNGIGYSEYFYKENDKSPLPKGDYYSKFDIKLGDKTVTCHRSFKIQ